MEKRKYRESEYSVEMMRRVIEIATRDANSASERISLAELEAIASELGISRDVLLKAIEKADSEDLAQTIPPVWRQPRYQALCLGSGIFAAASCMGITYLADRVSQPPLVIVGFSVFAM